MEANRKRTKVVRLPTEDQTKVLVNTYINPDKHNQSPVLDTDSRIKVQLDSGYDTKRIEARGFKYQHLYFITDEEIKEGDWKINEKLGTVWQHRREGKGLPDELKSVVSNGTKKIIASTDPKLKIITGMVGSGTGEPLPKPSQAFIEKYCKVGGIDEVDVEYENIIERVPTGETTFGLGIQIKKDKIVGTKPKVDSHNTITIHPIEEKMYDVKEVRAIHIAVMKQGCLYEGGTWSDEHEILVALEFDKYINENL